MPRTPSKRDKVIDSLKLGRQDSVAARIAGVSQEYVRRVRKKTGLPQSKKDTISEALRAGRQDVVIARETGVSRAFVGQVRKEIGLPKVYEEPLDKPLLIRLSKHHRRMLGRIAYHIGADTAVRAVRAAINTLAEQYGTAPAEAEKKFLLKD